MMATEVLLVQAMQSHKAAMLAYAQTPTPNSTVAACLLIAESLNCMRLKCPQVRAAVKPELLLIRALQPRMFPCF